MITSSDIHQAKINMVDLTLLLTSTLAVIVATTITPALPDMETYFQAVPNVGFLISLMFTIPLFAIAVFAPPVGYIIDKWGRKKLLLLTTLLYGIASSSGFFLNSLLLILVGRMLLGLAVAGIMTITTALIADYYHGDQRNKLMGYQVSIMSFGVIISYIAGGLLANINWHAPFLLYLGSLVLLPLILKFIYEPDLSQQEIKIEEDEPRTRIKLIIIAYALMIVFEIIFFLQTRELPFFLSQVVF
ncbi:MAG: MFS transporter, partial [Candidatus Hodarchaeota archaeon]